VEDWFEFIFSDCIYSALPLSSSDWHLIPRFGSASVRKASMNADIILGNDKLALLA